MRRNFNGLPGAAGDWISPFRRVALIAGVAHRGRFRLSEKMLRPLSSPKRHLASEIRSCNRKELRKKHTFSHGKDVYAYIRIWSV